MVGYNKKTALLEDAITQMNAGKYGRSSAALKELLALDPLHAEARRLFATLHLRLGSLMTARTTFESLAREALQRQDYWLTESLLREYLSAGPRCVPFLELLAHVYEEKGDPIAAVAEYGKAIEVLVEDPDPDRPTYAAELYAKVLELAPASPVAFRLAPMFDPRTGALTHESSASTVVQSPEGVSHPPAMQEDTTSFEIPARMPWEQIEDESCASSAEQEIFPLADEQMSHPVAIEPATISQEDGTVAIDSTTGDTVPSVQQGPLAGSADELASHNVVETEPFSSEIPHINDPTLQPEPVSPPFEGGLTGSSMPAADLLSAPMPWEQVEETTVAIPSRESTEDPAACPTAEPEHGTFLSGTMGDPPLQSPAPSPPDVETPKVESEAVSSTHTAMGNEPELRSSAPLNQAATQSASHADIALSPITWEEVLQATGSPASTEAHPSQQEVYKEALSTESSKESSKTLPAIDRADVGEETFRIAEAQPLPDSHLPGVEPSPENDSSVEAKSSAAAGIVESTEEPVVPKAAPEPKAVLRLYEEALSMGRALSAELQRLSTGIEISVAPSVPAEEPPPSVETSSFLNPEVSEPLTFPTSDDVGPASLPYDARDIAASVPLVDREPEAWIKEPTVTVPLIGESPSSPELTEPQSRIDASPSAAAQQPAETIAPHTPADEPVAFPSGLDEQAVAGWKSKHIEELEATPIGQLEKTTHREESSSVENGESFKEVSSADTSALLAHQFKPGPEVSFDWEGDRTLSPTTEAETVVSSLPSWARTGPDAEVQNPTPSVDSGTAALPIPEPVVTRTAASARESLVSAVDVLFGRSGGKEVDRSSDHMSFRRSKHWLRQKFSHVRLRVSFFIRNCFATTRSIVLSLVALAGIGLAVLLIGIGTIGLVWVVIEERPNNAFHNLSTTPPRGMQDPQKNGYLLLLGFNATSSVDPVQAGYERKFGNMDLEAARVCTGRAESTGLPRETASGAVLAGWYRTSDPSAQFRNEANGLRAWLASSDVPVSRYRQWLKMSFEDWGHGQSVSPPCQAILEAHRLYVAEGFTESMDSGLERLETDLGSWRAASSQARTLPMKMMAIDAIDDDVAVASGLLTRPDLDNKLLPRLMKLTRPLDHVEHSLRWPIQSELVLNTKTLDPQLRKDKTGERPFHVSVAAAMPLPKQKRFNDYAEYYEAAIKNGEVTSSTPVNFYNYVRTPPRTWIDYLLNPIDNVIGAEPLPIWDPYHGRILETDARLRLASLQAWIRRGSQDGDLLARVARAGQNFYDPFTGFPMLVNSRRGFLYSVGKDGKDDDADPRTDVIAQIPKSTSSSGLESKRSSSPAKSK
ncbi:MAG: hypothetical protein ACT4OO_08710 [Nitrospiraceae bacterium]